KDAPAAAAAWKQLARDTSLPPAHRDVARRRIAWAERVQKGLPPHDPAEHRVALPTLPDRAVVLHVAPEASPGGNGTAAKPLASLAAARDAIRAMRKSRGGRLPAGGVRVMIRGGVYPATGTFALAAEDSGTADAPIVYQARAGETVVLDGGVHIPAWRPISDAKLRETLAPAVRGRVVEADLKALGVEDLGDPTALRLRPELYCDGLPQTLARWPNVGFVKTGKILDKKGRFQYAEDRAGNWLDEPDVRLYGYWHWDWFEEYQKVAAIDPAARSFTLAAPYSHYGYRANQRYRAENVFRELDQPGEWYLDRRTSMVYWLRPEGVELAKARTTLSILARPFVSMDDVQHVLLLGLTFQDARGDGVHVNGGGDCLVAGCTLRRLGGDGVVVTGGRHHGIFGCTMHTLGCGGMKVAGGDLKTLAPGRHFVENCTVYDISRYKRTYTPAVLLARGGCGNRVAHCLFERMPSSAMRIEGSDQLIELNVIRHVVEESDDQGGLDMWGNPLYRGVVIRWNRWSDIRGGTHCGAAGVRLDDMISGVAVYGNIFERCGSRLFGGVQIHGGKANLVDNNVFVDCPSGISFSRWGAKRWLAKIQPFLKQAGDPLCLARYPDLARLKDDPDISFVTRNVFVGCKKVLIRDGGIQRTGLNTTIDKPLDVNAVLEQAAARSPQFRRTLFEPIPVKQIGPYPHPWRSALGP
ncbi:MAG: right-handed parallel beta-helix repeat-containing protein, partial [Candidatus Brocadiae bacterium]|nr:right-handed parallel beta-helix repeat-containing protein [Candidatus Brocadiia bacterium]